MKNSILIAMLVLSSFSVIAQSKNSIPKISAADVKKMIDTSTGPMIVNFWASWCGPCIREIPYFESGVEKAGAPVRLVLVSLDFPDAYQKTLPAFVKSKGYKSKVLYLNETNADKFIPIIDKNWQGAIPASIFVNNSKKYYQLYNQQLTEKGFELELKKLL
ncbi:TlpA family protein disulfide reductase [Segetibacter sp. 3557_3]|uniref:TlpA disulfide reductase family protein n=1 Tax=Segetibacter sp. 3557_3 TaxID=2547429 RepID=UPI0010589238|nr:TlpA disulfide reductase family protein [Segetibacter sp. 3557_3]TDH26404.1 TlpA family protein disulfide reductase [Segetibacter sp. 3557_3]